MRNYIFIGTITATFLLLFTAYLIGKSENNQFFIDQADFVNATMLIDDGMLEKADEVLVDLMDHYPDNFNVVWQKGWSAAQFGQIDEAIELFLKAQDLNPVLTRNPTFLIQFSLVMLNGERFEEALIYLEHAKNQRGITEEHLGLVEEWIAYAQSELEDLEEGKEN